MFLLDFLVALGVALLLTVIIAALFGSTGPWPYAWLAFLLILLVAWAAGTWARPVGPPLWGVYWMPFLVFGLIVALVIAAATPPDRARRRSGEVPASAGAAAPEEEASEETAVAVGMGVWIVFIVLLVALVLGYAL